MRFIRRKLTFANLVALLALFVALGGSAYAIHLGKNAVKTRNIKNGAVTEAKLAGGAVSAGKLAPGAVSGAGLGTIVIHRATATLPDGSGKSASVFCASNERPIGSTADVYTAGQADVATEGISPEHPNTSALQDGEALGPGDGFTASFHNISGGFTSQTFGEVIAICLK